MREAGRARVREGAPGENFKQNNSSQIKTKSLPTMLYRTAFVCVFSGVIPLVLQPRQAASLLPCRIEPRLLIS